MEKSAFVVPKMYADHHVLAVREALAKISGVQDVHASSAFKRVVVAYDPAATSAEAVQAALEEAGYGPDDCIACPPVLSRKEDGSLWHNLRPRVTETNRLDLEMSGDFRKY